MQYFVFVFNKHICYTTEFKLYGLISTAHTRIICRSDIKISNRTKQLAYF